ncbi:MAG: flagellar biosynthesis protein FliQ [Pseudomonadota bacterium]
MSVNAISDAIQHGLELAIILVAVLIVPSLLVGLVISMFQAATGIQEMTLSFIPKLFVVLLTLVLAGPWLLRLMVDFTRQLVLNVPFMLG